MRVVVDGDSLYILEEKTEHYDNCSAWHVDDGGDYLPIAPSVITRSSQGLDIFYIDYAPESVTFSALLVRDGKISNIEFYCYYVYVDFCPEPDPVDLPDTAILQDELEGWKIWTNMDIEPSEDNTAGQYSVYYKKPNSEEVYMLYTTNDYREPFATYNPDYEYVDWEHIQTGEKAWLVKEPEWGNIYAITEGCPDCRNIFTYMISLPKTNSLPLWFHTNSGYQGLTEDGTNIIINNYGYHEEEGRYEEILYHQFNGERIKG